MNRAALSEESTKRTPPFTFGWLATIPTARPPRRAKPTMISRAKRRLISSHDPALTTRPMTSYMSKYFRWSYGTIASIARPGLASTASRAGERPRYDRHTYARHRQPSPEASPAHTASTPPQPDPAEGLQ